MIAAYAAYFYGDGRMGDHATFAAIVVAVCVAVALAGCHGVCRLSGRTDGEGEADSKSKPDGRARGRQSPRSVVPGGGPGAGPRPGGSGTLQRAGRAAGRGRRDLQAHHRRQVVGRADDVRAADTTAEDDLAADAKRGVDVRVILDQHLEKSRNTATYNFLSAHRVHVTWATVGHDVPPEDAHRRRQDLGDHDAEHGDARTTRAPATSRSSTPARPTSPRSSPRSTPTSRTRRSPRRTAPTWCGRRPTRRPSILAVINSAKHTLAVENEEMGDSDHHQRARGRGASAAST